VLWQLLKFMIGRGKAKSVKIDICVLFSANDDETEHTKMYEDFYGEKLNLVLQNHVLRLHNLLLCGMWVGDSFYIFF